MNRLIFIFIALLATPASATTMDEIKAVSKELARIQANINEAIRSEGYNKIVQGDGIPPGPIAVECSVRHAGTFVGYNCYTKQKQIGQSQNPYNIATCQKRQEEYPCSLYRHGNLIGYWAPPFLESPQMATFEMPDGYYAWYGTAYRIGYGPEFEENFKDAVEVAYAKLDRDKTNSTTESNDSESLASKITSFLNMNTDADATEISSKLIPYQQDHSLPKYKGWCNPRMDDECYLNEVKVPYKDLPKYLPILNCEEDHRVEAVPYDPFCYEPGQHEIVRAVSHWRFKE